MCFDASQGNTTSPSQATAQSLAAQVKYAPQIYAQNATYSPLYTQLGLNNLSTALLGSNGKPGYLSLYEGNIAPSASRATVKSNSILRNGNMSDIQSLLPAMTAATRAQSPQAANLLDQLSQSAGEQLGYGTQLTPSQRLQLNQSVRAGQASRGMGFGPGDVFNESLAATNLGDTLLQQRQAQAGNVANQIQGFYGNDIAAILGQNANMGTASQLTAGGSGSVANANMMDPSQMASQFMGLATNTHLQNAAMQNQATETGWGNVIKSGSAMTGGASSMGMM